MNTRKQKVVTIKSQQKNEILDLCLVNIWHTKYNKHSLIANKVRCGNPHITNCHTERKRSIQKADSANNANLQSNVKLHKPLDTSVALLPQYDKERAKLQYDKHSVIASK